MNSLILFVSKNIKCHYTIYFSLLKQSFIHINFFRKAISLLKTFKKITSNPVWRQLFNAFNTNKTTLAKDLDFAEFNLLNDSL